jgi:hypothetical protein
MGSSSHERLRKDLARQFPYHTMLVGVRLEENGVERGNGRRCQLTQQGNKWLPTGLPRIPNSCGIETMSTLLAEGVGGAPVRPQKCPDDDSIIYGLGRNRIYFAASQRPPCRDTG